MGLDLGRVLAIMGTVFVGNPLSLNPGFSIGGPTGSVENLLGNVFGLVGKNGKLSRVKSWLRFRQGRLEASLDHTTLLNPIPPTPATTCTLLEIVLRLTWDFLQNGSICLRILSGISTWTWWRNEQTFVFSRRKQQIQTSIMDRIQVWSQEMRDTSLRDGCLQTILKRIYLAFSVWTVSPWQTKSNWRIAS